MWWPVLDRFHTWVWVWVWVWDLAGHMPHPSPLLHAPALTLQGWGRNKEVQLLHAVFDKNFVPFADGGGGGAVCADGGAACGVPGCAEQAGWSSARRPETSGCEAALLPFPSRGRAAAAFDHHDQLQPQ